MKTGTTFAREISENLLVIEDFLSPGECDQYILWSENKGYEEAKVQMGDEQRMMKAVRNNSRIMFTDEQLAEKLWNQLSPFVPAVFGKSHAIGLNEMFRFYKYEPGERFKRHRDGSYIRNETEASYFTFMVYLNADFKGGTTLFAKNEIVPKTGMALVFEHSLLHEGTPVTEGTKYVLRSDVMYKLNK